ncbi:unnamed protein product [Cuscuta epithymum]|uniref:RNase H type-1 domain-containing protein n=1 Tax=Cuscuta epithymum TaxID=186058 RepID=A0AAV0DZM3_9ASTE|nr:unnamed protein product [Cuscuta epithymum]
MRKAATMVGGWIQAQTDWKSKLLGRKQPVACWSRLISGRLKLNVDAAVRDSGCGLGWCLRDDRGLFVARAARPWMGMLSHLMAELVGISWLQGFEWKEIDVESDASGAISEILKVSSASSLGVVADDIRNLATHFSSISFFHVKRSANKSAHTLA